MTTPTPPSMMPDWMLRLADPASWQAWIASQQAALKIPGLATSPTMPQMPSMPSLAQLPGFPPLPAFPNLPAMPAMPSIPGMPDLNGAQIAIAPDKLKRLQDDYTAQLGALWQDAMAAKPVAVADRRFAAPAWQSNALHAFNAAAYLLNAKFLVAMTDALDTTPKVRQRLNFAIQQTVDAMSPANFLATNPEAQQKIIESKGESLARGIAHMLEDMKKGRISQSDDKAFEVGVNVANSEGAVVFENRLFQLIQYKPLTATVHERPLLLVPPCINKFYILDLQPANSLVRYAVEQGHTVFLVSWVNPDASLAQVTWDDYIEEGAITAIDTVRAISRQDSINTLGFCVGGTILASALAVMYGRGETPAASVTLLTALLDFTDTGILDVYIDDKQIGKREAEIGAGGLMPARDFSAAFSSLRPNDLVWNYVESNYLKGEEPPAFDLLYWNADGTNLPGPMFCWYLRNLYLDDSLKIPGKLEVAGEKIDLGVIDAPAFIYASREDHIVPWTSAYASASLLNPGRQARNRFILGASGHIAGVINPPAKNKRSYWTGKPAGPVKGRGKAAAKDNLRAGGAHGAGPEAEAQQWLSSAQEHPGSWWPQWDAFLVSHGGKKVPAPKAYGGARHKPIEPAPGRYVKVKAS
jgi:polyhydroxyalkanoate synthase